MNIPRPEYPRPRLVRDQWMNLNGPWQFEFDFGDSGRFKELWKEGNGTFDKEIIVPFVPECKLSGIEYTDFFTTCWYKRTFTLPENWDKENGKILLHIGAADFYTECWVNEVRVGDHRGGYTPFAFDVTKAAKEGENTIVIRCYDNGRDPLQYTGKQIYFHYANKSCYYTRCTGIWQTVWMEYVPKNYITKVKLTPDVDNKKLDATISFSDYTKKGDSICAEVSFEGKVLRTVSAKTTGKAVTFSIPMPGAKLWDLEHPYLYDLKLTFGEDVVKTYFGMRKIAINGYAIELNDKPVYQRLVLDQGFYEDSIITAPDVKELENDILISKKVGFNGARLHMKVFEPYTLYYADKLGYLCWGEFANWGLDDSNVGYLNAFVPGWLEAMERDYSSPALVGWCPLNETTPRRREDTFRNIYNITRAIDPYRPIIDSSGYVHVITDIYDVHDYDQDPKTMKQRYVSLEKGEGTVFVNNREKEKYEGQPYFVSEMGGIFWDISEKGSDDWGYGEAPQDMEEFYKRFEGLINVLLDNPKMCAFCYTQLTDVFQEKNGLYAFDRREKFNSERLYKILTRKAAIEKKKRK
ncbi:MAG: beta-galactosidase [Clostridia bacterium]|nr:beta-galactosidase [Clostridia bacterium]MBQ9130711.1 beta-galactosidase [Clostridia bacterium]